MNVIEMLFIVWFIFALGLSTYSMIFVVGLFVREAVNSIRKGSTEGYIMRWKKKSKEYPKDDDTRVITRFLLFPREVDGECRWLELVRIKQFYRGYDYKRNVGGFWVDKCWVDRH